MFEIFKIIVMHLEGMWRFRWYGLMVAWSLCLVGWFSVYLLPDIYEAKAQVYVDTQSMLKPLLDGLAVRTEVTDRIEMMTRVLVSRPHLKKIAEVIEPKFETKSPRKKQAILTRLEHTIIVGPSDRPNTYEMRYQDRNRANALRVVELLVETLVKDTVEVMRADTNLARRFLHEQIGDYEVRLKKAEQRLAEFKKKHVGMMPSQGQDYYSSLQEAIKALEKTNATLRLAINRRDELQKQLAGEVPSFGIIPTPVEAAQTSEIDKLIEADEMELERLRLQFTDQHPDVVALKQIIMELKTRQKRAKKTPAMSARVDQSVATSRVYQAIRIALSEAQVDVSTLRAKAAQLLISVDGLKKSVDTVPEVEAQLASLNRDYDITKAQYEALVTRLESARMSEQVELSNDEYKFRVIEPPVASFKPVGLDRLLFLSVVLLAGVLAAAGLMFLLHQVRPVFLNSHTLREVTGLPIFGMVSMQRLPKQRARHRLELASLTLGILLLILAFGGVVLLSDDGAQALQVWTSELKKPL